jgi:hypothetical protein
MLKNVQPYIYEAQALARNVLPVPGGPYKRIPFHGFRLPVKIYGKRIGIITAYFKAYLAFVKPATSSHLTSGFSLIIACANLFDKFYLSFLLSSLANIFFFYFPSLFFI